MAKFAMVAAGLAAFAAGIGLAARASQSPSRPNLERFNLSADPAIGDAIQAQLKDYRGQAVALDQGRTLILFLEACRGCTSDKARLEPLPYEQFDQVVVVIRARSSIENLDLTSLPQNARLVIDDQEALKRQINAIWPWRWYILESGRLTRLAKRTADRVELAFQ